MYGSASFFLSGASIGAGIMYLLDPAQGRRRRAKILDQIAHAATEILDAADVTRRDLQNRSYGAYARMRSSVVPHDNSDRVVIARVRSKLGHYVSHPSAIDVEARDGQVSLSGPILVSEVRPLLAAIKSVIGVRGVENHLDPHHTSENISALQGGRAAIGEQMEFMQRNWSPTARLCAGTLGGALLANCAATRTPTAMILGIVGCGLLGRAFFNRTPQWLTRSDPQPTSPSEPVGERRFMLPTGNAHRFQHSSEA